MIKKILFLVILSTTSIWGQTVSWSSKLIPNVPIYEPLWDIVFDVDTSRFYVNTDKNVYKYNQGNWTALNPPLSANEVLRFLALDNQGGVWATRLSANSVLRWYNNTWQKFDNTNLLLSNRTITAMTFDTLSKLMLFATDKGVATYNAFTNTWAKLDKPANLPFTNFDVKDIAINTIGEWFFAVSNTVSNPVYIYNKSTGWRDLKPFNNLAPDFCNIGVNKNNKVFVAGFQSKVAQYDYNTETWIDIPSLSGSGDYPSGFTVDKRNIVWYFSNSRGGVARYNGLVSQKFNGNNSPIYSGAISKVVVGPTNLKYILGSGGGIQILDDAQLPSATKEIQNVPSHYIESYNNPVNALLKVKFFEKTYFPHLMVDIQTIDGKLVSQNNFEQVRDVLEFNTSFLPTGIYIMRFWSTENQGFETIKISKF